MALSPLDPNLKLLFGLDESGHASVRANAAAANVSDDYAMHPWNDSGSEGCPAVTDDANGKAADLQVAPGSPFTSTLRGLRAETARSLQDHLDDGAIQDAVNWSVDGEGYTVGVRFEHTLKNKGSGGIDRQLAFGLQSEDLSGRLCVGLSLVTDVNTSPGSGLTPHIEAGAYDRVCQDNLGGWTTTGTPGAYPITDDGWYTLTMRVSYVATGDFVDIWVWLRNETTGTTYTYYIQVAAASLDNEANSYTTDGWRWRFGGYNGGAHMFYGTVDQGWYYDAPLTDAAIEDAIENGIDIPWIAPVYEVLDNRVRVAVTNERTTFPPTRPLPTGATAVDHPAGSYGTRPRLRYEGFEPNRPWALQSAEMVWDSGGRKKGKMNNRFVWDEFDKGVVRVPGRLAVGAMSDLRNVEFSGFGARRRRGFKVIKDPESSRTAASVNAFHSWRTFADELFRCAKVGTTLYTDDGSTGMTSLDTGWTGNDLPCFAKFRDRLFVLTPDRVRAWDGSAVMDPIEEDAPEASTSPSLTTGTLTGTFYYAYTFQDPTTGDETAPYEIGSLAMTAEGALLAGLDVTPLNGRFTNQYIYRTVAGGAAPDYWLIAIQANATSYTDSGDANGTIGLEHVNGTYTTLEMPEDFSAAVPHAGRLFYWGGTNKDRVYRSEANTANRFQADAYTAHDGPVRACLSSGSRLVVLTDRTVEIVESDWARDTNGASFERITVLSTTVGCPGHGCAVDVHDQAYWIDQRGAYRLEGDAVVKMSPLIDNIFRRLNWGIGATFSASYNPLREQVVWTVASAEFQDDSSQRQTQLVWQIGTNKWTIYGMDSTYMAQWDDDLNGLKFASIDAVGVMKELESYESDGVAAVTSAHSGTMTAVSANTMTDTGQSWTTDEFRGFGVILRDVSNGAFYYYTVRSNTATVLTFDREVSATLIATDGYYIGGIDGWFELAEVQMGSSNLKLSRQLHSEFDDLTRGDNL